MSAGLKVFKEDGSLLFDTEKIAYGLLKSGYLSLQVSWPRLYMRSAELNPTDPSSWAENSGQSDRILGFSVTGAVAPIVFIAGDGSTCGSSRSGNVTTFYYTGATTSTKFYYFDTMRNDLSGAGLKCFREDGELTFNSLQYPLNIVATVQPPNPGAVIAPGSQYRRTPYLGGTVTNGALIAGSAPNVVARVTVPIGAGEYAASIPFTRSCGLWGDQGYYPYTSTVQEGAGGVTGGVRFMFCVATRTTEYIGGATWNLYFNIPSVKPTALVIRTDDLPFPFN